jgi:hypothetical protein
MKRWGETLRLILMPCKQCGRPYFHLVHWGLTEDIAAHAYRVGEA